MSIYAIISPLLKKQQMRIWRNWQTRMVQVHVRATSCRFDSCYPHSDSTKLDPDQSVRVRLYFILLMNRSYSV